MKKFILISLSSMLLLMVSSLVFAKDGKSNGRWCNKLDGDFAGDCSDADVHCAPGWGLEEGTCEYNVEGVFVGGVVKTKGLVAIKVDKSKQKAKTAKKKLKSKAPSKK